MSVLSSSLNQAAQRHEKLRPFLLRMRFCYVLAEQRVHLFPAASALYAAISVYAKLLLRACCSPAVLVPLVLLTSL
jgi:hypothetical protein